MAWAPSEEQIEKVMEKNKRAIAIAYLRASRRARQAEGVVQMMSELDKVMAGIQSGDGRGAKDGAKKAARILQAMKEAGDA